MINISRSVKIFIGAILLFLPLAVIAQSDTSSYLVKRGDTLWKLAKTTYGSPWCWPLIASVRENNIDVNKYLLAGFRITLPPQSACDDILDPIRLENATLVSKKKVADVSDQPWDKVRGGLITDVLEGYRTPAEKQSLIYNHGWPQVGTSIGSGSSNLWSLPGGSGFYKDFASAQQISLDESMYSFEQDYKQPLNAHDKAIVAWWTEKTKKYSGFGPGALVSEATLAKKAGIAGLMRYADGSHWSFVVAEKTSDGFSHSRFTVVVDGVDLGTYYSAYAPEVAPNGKWAFRYQKTDPGCQADAGGCADPWFIKTSDGEYGPYVKAGPPLMVVSGDVYYFVAGDIDPAVSVKKPYVLYKNGKVVDSADFVDQLSYGGKGKFIAYRARKGDDWFAMADEHPSPAWDYIDSLATQADGSVVYRARNKAGEWLAVLNDDALKVPFEPGIIFYNAKSNKVMAFDKDSSADWQVHTMEIFSKDGDWKYPQPVMLIAADSKGRLLLKTKEVNGEKDFTKDTAGYSTSNSSVGSHEADYWLDDRRLGTIGIWRVPIYSRNGFEHIVKWTDNAPVYENIPAGELGRQDLYYGSPFDPTFNEHDQLTIYDLNNSILSRSTYIIR